MTTQETAQRIIDRYRTDNASQATIVEGLCRIKGRIAKGEDLSELFDILMQELFPGKEIVNGYLFDKKSTPSASWQAHVAAAPAQTDTPETLLYNCQVHSGDGRILNTLALVSDPCASTYEVQHPDTLCWLAVPSRLVVLGGRLDICQPNDDAPERQAWEYHPEDGWTYHPAPAAMPCEPIVLLRAAALRATRTYPAEATRIYRGYAIAVEDGVVLLADGTAIVSSQNHPGETYRINGQCTCQDAQRAPEGRCKHRYAVALVRWARKHAA